MRAYIVKDHYLWSVVNQSTIDQQVKDVFAKMLENNHISIGCFVYNVMTSYMVGYISNQDSFTSTESDKDQELFGPIFEKLMEFQDRNPRGRLESFSPEVLQVDPIDVVYSVTSDTLYGSYISYYWDDLHGMLETIKDVKAVEFLEPITELVTALVNGVETLYMQTGEYYTSSQRILISLTGPYLMLFVA